MKSKMTKTELEWSKNSPLSRKNNCGMCPYCGNLQIHGHHKDCKFLDKTYSVEEILADIEEADRQASLQNSQFNRFLYG